MNQNGPIRAGFERIKQNPGIVAIEIAWRWTFGLVATVLLLIGSRAFLTGLNLSEGDEQALRGQDPTMIAAALMHVLQQEGVWPRFFALATAVAIPSALVWVAAGTVGRAATLKRLDLQTRTSAILGLTLARAALLFLSILAWYLWMTICALITLSRVEPNYAVYVVLALLALPVIGVIWGILNWVLALAPVASPSPEMSAWQCFRDALRITRVQRGRFTSVSTWLGFPRLIAMVLALVVAVVFSVLVSSVWVLGIILTLITLVYCAFADYLYMVRLVAYAQTAHELPIATAASPP